jgi:hypothetical protein
VFGETLESFDFIRCGGVRLFGRVYSCSFAPVPFGPFELRSSPFTVGILSGIFLAFSEALSEVFHCVCAAIKSMLLTLEISVHVGAHALTDI